jgi:predicted DNA-binding transcriptional regulator AlpA
LNLEAHSVTTSISSPPDPESVLIDKHAVARLLGVSWRHVDRLRDRGAMPPPVKLGASVRWDRRAIVAWVSQGCPKIRQAHGQ